MWESFIIFMYELLFSLQPEHQHLGVSLGEKKWVNRNREFLWSWATWKFEAFTKKLFWAKLYAAEKRKPRSPSASKSPFINMNPALADREEFLPSRPLMDVGGLLSMSWVLWQHISFIMPTAWRSKAGRRERGTRDLEVGEKVKRSCQFALPEGHSEPDFPFCG